MAELNFKPVTEGLGFHPFSNGLPYASVNKVQAPAPRPPLPVASMPTAAKLMATPIAPTPIATQATEEHGWGYLARRATAYVLDSILNTGLVLAALGAGLWNQSMQIEALLEPGVVVIFIGFLLAFHWAIVTAQEIVFHTTLGKRTMGLKISGTSSQIFLRSLLFIPSIGFCFVGILWALFDEQKRCWHDVASDIAPEELTQL